MTESDQHRFLIVGQGLAGSALALALRGLGAQVMVVDDQEAASASRVAAGLITTLAGKGMNPAWRQEEYLPVSWKFYTDLEEKYGVEILQPLPVVRPFSDEKEKAKFHRGREKKQYWLEYNKELPAAVRSEFGHFTMGRGGRLDVIAYLELVKTILGSDFCTGQIKKEDLNFTDKKVQYKGITYDKVIFCTGYRGLVSEYFHWLPSRSAKGEMLDVSIPGLDEGQIISRGGWLVPLGNNQWRAGATYSWDDLNTTTSDDGRKNVEQRIRSLIDLTFKVEKQLAGIRPIVNNSQPVIGLHPENVLIGIFNGLGSKGVLSALPVGLHFAEFLMGKTSLDSELDVNRVLKE